jgi:hypothetical protein
MLAEDLALATAQRGAVGQLGGPAGVERVVDSVQVLGRRPPRIESPQVSWLDLDQPGAVVRWTGADLASSAIPGLWPVLVGSSRQSDQFGTLDV